MKLQSLERVLLASDVTEEFPVNSSALRERCSYRDSSTPCYAQDDTALAPDGCLPTIASRTICATRQDHWADSGG